MSSPCIYLDYNATSPIDPEVAAEMLPFMQGGLDSFFGNPSSAHTFGKETKAALRLARERVAASLNCKPSEVFFCSGGTESINHVVKSLVFKHHKRGAPLPHVITSAIEHVAVLDAIKWTVDNGFATSTIVPVDSLGFVSPQSIASAVTDNTVLVSVMLANNEVGTVQPIAEIAEAVRAVKRSDGAKEMLVHTDASQVCGKLPVDTARLRVDFLTVAGHKLYAPKAIGITFMREGTVLPAFIHGAGQENGTRAGTENIMFAAALGKAFEIADRLGAETTADKHRGLRSLLIERLCANIEKRGLAKPVIHGPLGAYGAARDAELNSTLPNTLSIAFPGAFAAGLVGKLAKAVAVSAGAACHSTAVGDPSKASTSHVLDAMRIPRHLALCTLRLTVGRWTTEKELEDAAEYIAEAVESVAKETGEVIASMSVSVAEKVDRKFPSSLETDALFLRDTYNLENDATLLASCVLADCGMVIAGTDKIVAQAMAGFSHAVILDRTVAHPQGGGQPSDRGVILMKDAHVHFEFYAVRYGLLEGSQGIVHYGRWVAASTEVPGSTLAEELPPMPSNDKSLEAPDVHSLVGKICKVYINRSHRLMAARLHSAGHLLDMAVHNVYARLLSDGDKLETLVPGKGYHFADGPNVEYVGSIPPEWRDRMLPLLNAECDRLVRETIPTIVSYIPQTPAELAEYGLSLDDCKHLAADKPVRVVMVAGRSNPCPCGGTHIGNTVELGCVTITKITVKKGRTKLSYTISEL